MLTVDFTRLPIDARSRVLDIGCGNGRHTFEALRLGADVTATDLDEAALQEVRNIAAAMDDAGELPETARLSTVCGDARRLLFAAESFDVVIACEVLEHIEDDLAAMRELRRVLRPGGVLAVSVPRWWPERICWALSREYHDFPGGHTRIYRRRQLAARLREAGFAMAPFRDHAHALHAPYWWLRCAVGVKRDNALPARLYHRMLVWDLTRRPRITRVLERALNPVLGKSLVVYARRPAASAMRRAA